MSGAARPQPVESCTQLLLKLERASRALRSGLAAQLASLGLGDTHFLLLHYCHAAGSDGVHQRELATALAVSPAQISGLVEDLRRQQLIVGFRPPQDRRRQVWQLTDQGRELLATAESYLQSWAAAVLAGHDNDRLTQLTAILDGLSTSNGPAGLDLPSAATQHRGAA